MIESLEPRIAPAGIVDLKLAGGVLTANTLAAGDGEENVVISQIVDGQLRVDPAIGTRVQFNGQLFADGELVNIDGVAGLTVMLGAGNDTLTIVNARLTRSLVVNLGEGANSLTLTNGDIGGNVSVTAEASADTVTINGSSDFTVVGKATFSLGEGDNVLTSTNPIFSIGRNFTFRSGSGDDSANWSGDSFNVHGKFSAITGDGASSVEIAPTLNAVIGRDVVMTSINTDPAASILQRIAPMEGLFVGGNLKFSATTGDVQQQIQADNASLTIAGSVDLAGGGAKSSQSIDSHDLLSIGGNLRVLTRATDRPDFVMTNGASPQGSFIGGSVTLLGQQAMIYSAGGNIKGNVTLRTGNGLPGNVALGFDLSDGIRIAGNLTVVTNETAASTATVSLAEVTVDKNFQFTGGAGNTTAILNDSFFLGSATIDLGAGDDLFRLESFGIAGVTVFYGKAIFRGGDGADTFVVGGMTGADVLNFRSTSLFDGGAGADTTTQGTLVTFLVPSVSKNFP